MEYFVLIAVITAFSRAAKSVALSRFSWGASGGVVYVVSLVLTKMALYQMTPPSSNYLFLFGILDVILSNSLALIAVCHLGRVVFGYNPIDFVKLARIFNVVWLVFTPLLLLTSISLIISSERPASYFHIVLIMTIAIPIGTMIIHRRMDNGIDLHSFIIPGAMVANYIAALAAIYYVYTLKYSLPIAYPLVECYCFTWLAIAACLNVFSLQKQEFQPANCVLCGNSAKYRKDGFNEYLYKCDTGGHPDYKITWSAENMFRDNFMKGLRLQYLEEVNKTQPGCILLIRLATTEEKKKNPPLSFQGEVHTYKGVK
jgi:hypothetical protein